MQGLQNNPNPSKYKILLVEDQPVIRIIHINFLESLGCFVYSAENGTQALNFLKTNLANTLNDFDLVFMDMGLPDISGIEVVKTYRKLEESSKQNLSIVALTAYGGKDDRQKFMEAGVNEVVVKPVTIQQLNQILIKYIDSNKAVSKDIDTHNSL